MLKRISMLPVVVASAIAVAGCGNSISATTSCNDFLHASPQDQDAAVSKVAADQHAPNSVTPLGRPNINYICASAPNMTLGDAVSHTG
jgi:hypothetical protein